MPAISSSRHHFQRFRGGAASACVGGGGLWGGGGATATTRIISKTSQVTAKTLSHLHSKFVGEDLSDVDVGSRFIDRKKEGGNCAVMREVQKRRLIRKKEDQGGRVAAGSLRQGPA